MATVADVLDRANREWLYPPGNQPSTFKVDNSGDLTSGATSVVTDTSWLSPEEEDSIGAGRIIEIDREWMLVEAVSGSSPALTLTIRRGDDLPYGTPSASHSDNSIITLAPEFPRQTVYDAFADVADDLWPRLWKVETDFVGLSTGWVEVDDEVEEVFEALIQSGSQWLPLAPGSVTTLLDFPLASSERAIQFHGLRQPHVDTDTINGTVIIKYKKKAKRPSAETDTLASLNIEDSWQKILTVGIAASVLRGSDIEATRPEYITEALEREGFPVGSGESISNALLRYQDFLINRRAAAQNVRTPPTQEIIKEL